MPFLQLTIPQIKAEMEKTLQWLVPIATNTTKYGFIFSCMELHFLFLVCCFIWSLVSLAIVVFTIDEPESFLLLRLFTYYLSMLFLSAICSTRAHHGFGWVGEWANTGEYNNNCFCFFIYLSHYLAKVFLINFIQFWDESENCWPDRLTEDWDSTPWE